MTTSTTSLVESMAAAWNTGDAAGVIALAAQAAAAGADSVEFLGLLGVAQQQTGDYARAAVTFERLAGRQPGVSAWWNNLGVARRMTGSLVASEQALMHARSLAPQDADVLYNLGLVHIQQRHWAAARDALLDAVQLAPQSIEVRLQAAQACHVCGDIEGEEALLKDADRWPPQPVEQALVLASILSVLGRLDTGLAVLAQAIVPAGPDAKSLRLRITAQRVALYERNNLVERAHRELENLPLTALDALPVDANDTRIDAWRAHAVMASRQHRHAEAAALYQRVLDVATDDETRAGAAFGLAAARNRLADYRSAWTALDVAHAAQMAIVREAAPKLSAPGGRPLPMAARVVDADAYAAWQPLAAPPAQQSPVFVIGFPRSGTTLLEQMLDAHPDFRSMDERGFVYQLIERMEHAGQHYPADLARLTEVETGQLRAVYWRLVADALPDLGPHRLVDKNPLNMLCLPMIQRLFPAARIVLCVRHPCDVLLSCYMQSFRSPTFMAMCASLPRLARGYAEAFEQCFQHIEVFKPHVLEWRYESVVADFAGAVARLGEFLDVVDAAQFAHFATHAQVKQFIATPSYAQVTQPVNAKAVGRWVNYRERLEPLLPVLRPWLERFGYGA